MYAEKSCMTLVNAPALVGTNDFNADSPSTIEDTQWCNIRGAFGTFLAWYFISVTDLQILSLLVSF